MKEIKAGSVEELDARAAEILEAIGSRRVVAMDAPMGAGKTTLVKSLCKALGSVSIVNSPTFAIINDYELPDGGSVYHFDLYRLKDASETLNMGMDEYLYSGNYCFVEWPELSEPLLPEDTCWLRIRVGENGERTITIE